MGVTRNMTILNAGQNINFCQHLCVGFYLYKNVKLMKLNYCIK